MANSENGDKADKAAISECMKPERTYYRINEILGLPETKKLGFTVEDLLDFGANGKLTLSFAVVGRYIISGDYHQGKEIVENPPHYDEIFNGPLSLPSVEIWKIIIDGESEIEFLYRSEAEFSRIDRGEKDSLPVVGRDQILITKRDWQLFLDGMPPDPIIPVGLVNKTKKSETLTIGALTYLYAQAKPNKSAYFKADWDIYIERVTQDVVQLLHSGQSHYPGASDTTVQGLISAALKLVTPVLKATAGK
jgi:hypothetical protein